LEFLIKLVAARLGLLKLLDSLVSPVLLDQILVSLASELLSLFGWYFLESALGISYLLDVVQLVQMVVYEHDHTLSGACNSLSAQVSVTLFKLLDGQVAHLFDLVVKVDFLFDEKFVLGGELFELEAAPLLGGITVLSILVLFADHVGFE